LTKENDERLMKVSKDRVEKKEKLGYLNSSETRIKMSKSKKGKVSVFKGKHHTEKAKEKNRITHLGKRYSPATEFKKGDIPWNKGKKGDIPWNKGKKLPPLSKEHIKKCLRRRTPSSLEVKFQTIIDKHNLPYKYVGNGKFFIERLNPDFVNTNNEKIAIEVYARFYKELNGRNIKDWKEKRTKVFKKYGWENIFFNEIQDKEDYVLATLGGESN